MREPGAERVGYEAASRAAQHDAQAAVRGYVLTGEADWLTPYERAALARSRADLRVLKWRARADGHVSRWERRRIHAAQARHDALAFRYRHN